MSGNFFSLYFSEEAVYMSSSHKAFISSGSGKSSKSQILKAGGRALVPWYREYQLGKCAGKVPEGRAIAVTAFIVSVIRFAGLFIKNEYILLFFGVIQIMAAIINVAYSIQVYSGLIDVYNVRKRWLWLWIFAEPIPALIWGFSNNYQPSWKAGEFRDNAVSHVQGTEITDMGEGLTVNLIKREVPDGFFHKKELLKDIHMNIKPGRLVMLRDIYKEYDKMKFECGFVPQSDLIRGKDTVLHTLMDYATMRLPSDFTLQDRKDRVEEALKIFGLAPVQNSMVSQLSGGQRKRLSIAMEFLSNPSMLILDEPDSGVDGVMAKELFRQMRKVADTGRIVIAITHTPDRVVDMFDDVIILAKDSNRTGRLAFYGTVDKCRKFFDKERMEEVVKTINRPEEGGDGRADEFIIKYAQEVQHV